MAPDNKTRIVITCLEWLRRGAVRNMVLVDSLQIATCDVTKILATYKQACC